jgi:hypothetical protein
VELSGVVRCGESVGVGFEEEKVTSAL